MGTRIRRKRIPLLQYDILN